MVSLKMTGGPELARALRALPEEVRQPVLLQALFQAGEPIRARAEQLAPKGPDAPHIADHIAMSEVKTFEGVRVSDTEAAIAIGPTKGYFYGFFWEFGWSKHPVAHPFMRPAWDGGVEKAFAYLGRALWTAISRATGR